MEGGIGGGVSRVGGGVRKGSDGLGFEDNGAPRRRADHVTTGTTGTTGTGASSDGHISAKSEKKNAAIR